MVVIINKNTKNTASRLGVAKRGSNILSAPDKGFAPME